jgi:tRNA pseudouridine38-40 synthase
MRIALGIEYDGSRYFGWQRQREVISVQAELETALSRIANHPVSIQCAGRTDAGVHATGQVIHFDTEANRAEGAWTLGLNSNLPPDIAVRWVKQVDESFHARFSATARRYRYVIYNHNYRPAILGSGVSHYHETIDAELMHRAGQSLLGEHDFSTFRAVACQSNTPWRNVTHLCVSRQGPYIVLDIRANAFLHHMVRNITGSLLLAGPTAKAGGLYLVDVDYPAEFALPQLPLGPLWLPDSAPGTTSF